MNSYNFKKMVIKDLDVLNIFFRNSHFNFPIKTQNKMEIKIEMFTQPKILHYYLL